MRAGTIMALAAVLAWPAVAHGQVGGGLRTCDDAGVDLTSLAVDERSGVRTFYQGSVTLLALNTEEPAAAPAGIAIVMPAEPVENEPLFLTCWAITGYAGVNVEGAQARYDPAEGLTLTIPTLIYDPERDRDDPAAPIRLRINASRGTIVDLNQR